jgi:hypothetical protein
MLDVSNVYSMNGAKSIVSIAKADKSILEKLTTDSNKMSKYSLGVSALSALAVATISLTKKFGSKQASNMNLACDNSIRFFKMTKNKLAMGRAIQADGSAYTGVLTHKADDGSFLALEYMGGLLRRSTKTNKNGQMFEKSYIRGDNNLSVHVETRKNGEFVSYFDKVINKDKGVVYRTYSDSVKSTNSIQDVSTGKILCSNGKDFYYTKSGMLRATRDVGGVYTEYHYNGNPKFVRDSQGLRLFNEDGLFISGIRKESIIGADGYSIEYPDKKVRYFTERSKYGQQKSMEFNLLDGSQINLKKLKSRDGKINYYATARYMNDKYYLESNNGIVDILKNNKEISKYNPKTKEMIMLDTNADKKVTKKIMANVEKCVSDIKKEYKFAHSMKERYDSITNSISKSTQIKGWHDRHFCFQD